MRPDLLKAAQRLFKQAAGYGNDHNQRAAMPTPGGLGAGTGNLHKMQAPSAPSLNVKTGFGNTHRAMPNAMPSPKPMGGFANMHKAMPSTPAFPTSVKPQFGNMHMSNGNQLQSGQKPPWEIEPPDVPQPQMSSAMKQPAMAAGGSPPSPKPDVTTVDLNDPATLEGYGNPEWKTTQRFQEQADSGQALYDTMPGHKSFREHLSGRPSAGWQTGGLPPPAGAESVAPQQLGNDSSKAMAAAEAIMPQALGRSPDKAMSEATPIQPQQLGLVNKLSPRAGMGTAPASMGDTGGDSLIDAASGIMPKSPATEPLEPLVSGAKGLTMNGAVNNVGGDPTAIAAPEPSQPAPAAPPAQPSVDPAQPAAAEDPRQAPVSPPVPTSSGYEGHRFQSQLDRASRAGNTKEIDRLLALGQQGDALFSGASKGREGAEFSDPALSSYKERRNLYESGQDPNAFNASMGEAAKGLITKDFDRQAGGASAGPSMAGNAGTTGPAGAVGAAGASRPSLDDMAAQYTNADPARKAELDKAVAGGKSAYGAMGMPERGKDDILNSFWGGAQNRPSWSGQY